MFTLTNSFYIFNRGKAMLIDHNIDTYKHCKYL